VFPLFCLLLLAPSTSTSMAPPLAPAQPEESPEISEAEALELLMHANTEVKNILLYYTLITLTFHIGEYIVIWLSLMYKNAPTPENITNYNKLLSLGRFN